MMRVSRRELLMSLPAIAAAARALGQTSAAPIRVTGINHVTLSVSDVQQSVDFYQGLFGMPIASRQGSTRSLSIGAGPQALGISSTGSDAPNINHICLGVDGFNLDRVTAALASRGFTRTDEAGNAGGGGLRGPMKMRVRVRGPETGGARDGTRELYFSDPDGIVMQLQDSRYCGGAGRLGNLCAAMEPSPRKGLLALKGWSHCTIFVSDGARSNLFYADLLGLRVQGYQGPGAPLYGVGGRGEFIMFAGSGGRGRANATPRSTGINHLCMSLDNFDPERVIKALESYGIKARGETQGPAPAGPLVHYISRRMENRGGAKEGTPELYFTDPDSLLIQLQDTKYCGGAGVLGEICRA